MFISLIGKEGSGFSCPIPTTNKRQTVLILHERAIQNDKGSRGNEDRGISVGIDLGTTNSAIAILTADGTPTIVPVPHSGRTMPSVVAFQERDSSWIVGRPAQDSPAEQTYRNVKRVIGTGGKLSRDIFETVPHVQPNPVGKTYKKDSLINQLHDAQENPTLLRYVSTTDALEEAHPEQMDETFRPEVISSHVLRALRMAAEAHTGRPVQRAVIGVPAYFHNQQRAATIQAATLAGIPQVKLLREPEAAALAYGIAGKQRHAANKNNNNNNRDDEDELVLVFDLGGGTFDVSMLAVGGGVTEIICTSGNAFLGGSVLDARLAQHFWKVLSGAAVSPSGDMEDAPLKQQQRQRRPKWSEESKTAMVLAAEAVRIHLSNNRWANVALPRDEETWTTQVAKEPSSVLLPHDYELSQQQHSINNNATHVIFQLTRREMERLCDKDFQALLRPVREVAIMSGALLPGDASPTMVEDALEMEEEYKITMRMQDQQEFEDFYNSDGDDDSDDNPQLLEPSKTADSDLMLLEMDLIKQAKKAQQGGRQRARNVAKQERKFRLEKRKLGTSGGVSGSAMNDSNVKVRDGIGGRPISRVVLVGGATRTPAIGRLLEALTGVTPQRTVDPDEAVALGCAVHAAILDGQEDMGTILNPMQAAILKAMAKQQRSRERTAVEQDDDYDIDEVE